MISDGTSHVCVVQPCYLLEAHTEQVTQNHVQSAFEGLQRCRYALPQQLAPLLSHHYSQKCFLMFSWNSLCFSSRPSSFVLALGTTGNSLAPISLHPPFRYVYILTRFHLIILHRMQPT